MFTSNLAILCSVSTLILIILSVVGLLSRYRRCASDEILVIFGKAGKSIKKNPETGKNETTILPSKIVRGGGAFVFPIIQDWAKMSLRPLQIQVTVSGVSSQMIKVSIPVTLTTAVGTSEPLMQDAAGRFLTASTEEISGQIKDILIGEVRSLMATMTIEEINANRAMFIGKAKENIETELNKVGFTIININNADISDEADYIKNLGQKAATKAQAQAQADIAEEKKRGDIQIANTEKERQTAVAEAERERATKVAKAKQEQDVKVAEINQEREIRLAEAEKIRETGVADQEAEKKAAVAQAEMRATTAEAEANAQQQANVAKSTAEAESAKAARKAEAAAAIARSEADAEAAKAEAEALKQIRTAKAKQEQEAETQKAINEQEAKVAEYESTKRQRAAEADKKAGVTEQKATIEVSVAKGEAAKAEAEANRVAGVSKVEAEMEVAKTKEQKQIEVNEVAALAAESKLKAEMIIPAQKKKEQVTIEAEAVKQKAILEAEAEAAKILKKAQAEADATKLKLEAEAEGNRKKLLAEAEGKRASLMAEADKVQAVEMAPALAVERMIAAGLSPDLVVNYKMTDQLAAVAEAQAKVYEHIQLGQVTVYGDTNTAGNFMANLARNISPVMDMVGNLPIADNVKKLFGKADIEEKKD